MIKLNKFLMLITLLLLFIGSTQIAAAEGDITITLQFTNLADPGDDHYEGWIIADGEAITTGKFTLDSSGNIVDLDGNSIDSFTVPDVDIDDVSKFVLTLEPNGDTDTIPAGIKPLAGDLNSDKTQASLSINLGVDLGTVAGSYILATPSDGADTNENSGIWYLDPTGGDPVAGLTLPDLTGTDWIYEGWLVFNGTPVTSGTFDKPAGEDNSDPYSGDQAIPPFPGEDYLQNAPSGLSFPTDLSGATVVVSIEPRIDNSPDPFQFKPLSGDVPDTAVDHTLYDLNDNTASLATGTANFDVEAADNGDAPGFLLFEVLGVLLVMTVPVFVKRAKKV